MNLLTVLLKSLLTDSSVHALAKKTGVSTAVLKKLIPLAIPLLIKFMTGNAQSQSGAQSLLSALGQHTSKKSLPEQIEEADIDDGGKILHHIFGSQSDNVMNQLSAQSGISEGEVNRALSGLAPSVLSGLSAAAGASPSASGKVDLSDGLDLGELMILLGGQGQASSGSGSGLLSGLLGGGSSSPMGGLLGSLFGGSTVNASQDNSFNGNQLLSLLGALR